MMKAKETIHKKTLLHTELQGDFGVWLVIYVELFVFAVIFTGYCIARYYHVEVFNASQLMLNKSIGLINTLLLITSSYYVAKALENVKDIYSDYDINTSVKYLFIAILLGIFFILLKSIELQHIFAQGIHLSTNIFFTFYILLALFHMMHVLLGIYVLIQLYLNTKKGKYTKENHIGLESGALYWHMVDLLWIILFALVYILR